MLEVRIYENDKMIWMRRKEDMYNYTCRTYSTDGTFERIKEVLEDALYQVNGGLGLFDITNTVSDATSPTT